MKLIIFLFFGLASCSEIGASRMRSSDINSPSGAQVLDIGETPMGLKGFGATDCSLGNKFTDCQAVDTAGRKYIFFEGVLSRVEVRRREVGADIELPAGLEFGESIEIAKAKVSSVYGVTMDRGLADGRVIYSSDFELESSSGAKYSIELVADRAGRLDEVIQRTDF